MSRARSPQRVRALRHPNGIGADARQGYVQGTAGADFHKDLAIPHAEVVIIRKGFRAAIDSYSAFRENDRKSWTGQAGYLRERGLSRVFIAGLALDFCVRYSAEDAQREGFTVFVIEDASRAIDVEGSLAATHGSLAALGVARLASRSFFDAHF
jgi:nicotinamidase/pyrazinamidase